MTKRFGLVVLAVLLGTVMLAWAQVPAQPPDVLSGADIGFQLERTEKDRAVGRLMVRVNGQWMEAQFLSRFGVIPVQTK